MIRHARRRILSDTRNKLKKIGHLNDANFDQDDDTFTTIFVANVFEQMLIQKQEIVEIDTRVLIVCQFKLFLAVELSLNR